MNQPENRRLRFEPLEDRRMLAVITVDSLLDNFDPGAPTTDGVITLREAIVAANTNTAAGDAPAGSVGVDTINFDAALAGQTITLGPMEELEITEALTIDATALAQNVTIDAKSDSRIFNITATSGDFTFAGLTLIDGQTFASNETGGAIRSLTTGSLTIDQSTISGSSTTGFNAGGGGIYSVGNVTLTDSTVSGNSTAGFISNGGGIFSVGAVTLTSSTVSGNSTAGSAAPGGGIRSSGNVSLTQSTVSGNSTAGGSANGGGISSGGTATLTSSTVSGNSTTGSSANGGGISSGGNVTLNYSTVTANFASDALATGGGIWNNNDPIIINNSIVAGNTAGGGNPDIRPGTGALNVDFSLIEDIAGLAITGSNNITGMLANLGPLASNGGLTETHALLAGSPAIDAGDLTILFDANEFDQRGAPFVRVFDGGVAGLRIDIGATERQTLPALNLVVDTLVDENDGDYSAGDLSLREAIGLANGSVGDDTILFDANLDAGTIDLQSAFGEINIIDSISIDASNLAGGLTVDAGDGTDNTFNTGDGFRIFNIDDGNTGNEIAVTLRGLTLTGGDVADRGGAINSQENLRVENSTILGNAASNDGGGIRAFGTTTIDSSTLSGNSTGNDGGGIRAFGTTTIISSTISGNSASDDGGGIQAYGMTAITSSTISGNSTGDDGGGIKVFGTTTIISSTLSGNLASVDGGGIFALSATTEIITSTISGNTAGDDGGGIYVRSGTTTISTSTISGNSAVVYGGGIYTGLGTTTILSSTITDNSAAAGKGSGVASSEANFTDTRVGSTIISGNTGSDDVLVFDKTGEVFTNSFTSLGNNLIGGGASIFPFSSDGTSVISTSPGLGLLQNNSGPTETHALLPGSLAIDEGTTFANASANAARGGAATQSSTVLSFPANRAIDGTPFSIPTKTTPSDVDPFWQVVMTADQEISQIVLHNDGIKSTLRDITVEILDVGGNVVFTSPLLNPENIEGGSMLSIGPATLLVDLGTLAGGPVIGRTVRVSRTSDPDLSGTMGVGGSEEQNVLSLAEVEVFTVDQRGLPRVVNGGVIRQDIGAFELQGPIANITQVTTVLTEGTIGFIDIDLGLPVAVSPGVLLNYAVSTTSGLVEGVDFYTSQLDLSTVDGVLPTNSLFIAEGQSSARISVAALSDAIAETGGVISFTLLADDDTFQVGTGYELGHNVTATIFLQDSGQFSPGIVTVDAFDEASPNLFVDALGNATTLVKLASEPTSPVTVNISNPAVGTLNTSALNFTIANWDVPQAVTVSGLGGSVNNNGQNDLIASLTLSTTTGDAAYNVLSEVVTIYDEPSEAQLKLREGGTTQTITPTVSIRRTTDAIEGVDQPGSFLVSSDVPAPVGGLRVFYSVTQGAGSLGTQYNIVNSSTVPRFVDIPAGQLSTSVVISAVDDPIAESDLSVEIELGLNLSTPSLYQISPTQTSAQLLIVDNDIAAIETAQLTNIAAVDTTFDADVNVGDLFSLDVTSLSEVVGGATATVQVSLTIAPTANVVLTFADANSASTQQVTFTPANFATAQSVTLNMALATDTGLDLFVSTNANGDANYDSLAIDLPFRQTATPFNVNTVLATAEAGTNFSFGIRLSSQPTAPVTVSVASDDTSEGTVSAMLSFNATNWSTYQVATVAAVDDNLFDGDKTYNILVDAASADLAYDPLAATFPLTNQDDESRSNQLINTENASAIVATIRPVAHTAGEGIGPGQFEIVLSENAPVGGLLVDYSIFDGTATAADIDVPRFLEKLGDSNPLSFGHVGQSFTTVGAQSLAIGDLDNDDDLDVLLSLSNGITRYFENVGTQLFPEFEENLAENPLAATGGLGSELGDVDGDGDLDIIQIASENGPIRYFENQIVETGSFGFVERTGAANPFGGLGSLAVASLSLVDIDGDGQLELLAPQSPPEGSGTNFFEFAAGAYVASGANPLDGVFTDLVGSLEFVDWDNDRDFDLFVGEGGFVGENDDVRYLENVGTRTAPLFVERTGAANPANGISGDNFLPAVVDLDGSGTLDLLLTRFISTGPGSGVSEIRYFDASRVQEVLIPAGTSSLIVDIPIIDDLNDEQNETLDVALVSRIPQANGIEAAGDFLQQTGSTVLALNVTQALGAGQIGLQIGAAEALNSYVLEVNTQLTFSGGTVATVTARTVIDKFQQTILPITLNSGTSIGSGETVDINVILGEIVLRANAPDFSIAVGDAASNFLALSAGDSLSFSGGATFVVATPELLDSKTFGDYDSSGGAPNGGDFLNWQRATGSTGGGIGADGNGNGVVDGLDLGLWVLNFGRPADEGGVSVTGYLTVGSAIAAGETTSLDEVGYRVGTKLVVTSALAGSNIGLRIDDSAFSSFTVPAGLVLSFSGGGFATVSADTLINSATGSTVPVTLVEGSSTSIAIGEQTSTSSFSIGADQRVSSVTLTLLDNDEAGIVVTPSGTTTTEAGATQTIDFVLNTQPSNVVFVNVGAQGDEALLSDSDQNLQKVVQLAFTPQNWDVGQTVTVTGLNDDIDDGDVSYKILTTIVSQDVQYSDDTVPIVPSQDIAIGGGVQIVNLVIDDPIVPDVTLSSGSQLVFNNGATFSPFGGNLVLNNVSPATAIGTFTGPNLIGTNRTAKVHDGDQLTRLVVTSAYNSGTGTVGLQIDSAESRVLAATLAAGHRLVFSNGVRATLTADVTLTNSGAATASVTLSGGTTIAATDTSFFEETLIVRMAFDTTAGTIGLEVEDESIASITFASNTIFEFSNGTLATLGSLTAFFNATQTSTPITLDANTITTRATAFFREQLVSDLTFTNTDDDTAGVVIDRTDHAAAFAEGEANNFFKVVLSAEPIADVVVTLTPSADDIRLNSEIMGEPLEIIFTANNWDIAQTIEVTAIDDDVVEFDHLRDVTVSLSTTDPVYNSLPNIEKIRLFIQDDDLPTARVRTVAGAIEANSPGFFMISLDVPVPASAGETGIVVSYSIGGTADSNLNDNGLPNETDDVQSIAGTVRIAPGSSQSELIAFPIDDFKAEGQSISLESESVIVTLTTDANSRYKLSDTTSATLTILDNDIPGVRVLSPSGTATAIEGDADESFFVSLLSQPTSNVTITFAFTTPQTSRQLLIDQAYASSATSIGLRVSDPTIYSLLLPAGTYTFGTTVATVTAATTIFSDKDTSVPVTLNGNIGSAAVDRTGAYSYTEIGFTGGTNTLTFTPTDWFKLQTVSVAAVDDNVVEKGSFHARNFSVDVASMDTAYDNFAVPNQTVNIVDRVFDIQNTAQSLTQSFLALQDSIENVELPILGNLGDVAPPFLTTFIEDLSTEIRAVSHLTVESLTESFNTAINNVIVGVNDLIFEVTEIASGEQAFLLSFSNSVIASVNLDNDFGLEALNLSIKSVGTVDLSLDYDLSFRFGINATDGFFIDTNQTSFSVGASLALSEDFTATGELGFLQLDITNGIDLAMGDTEGTAVDAMLDISLTDDVGNGGNGDGKLTLAEMIAARSGNPLSFISYTITGSNPTLDLDVTTSFGGNTSFPSFSFNLNGVLPLFNYANDAEANGIGGGFDLNFDDITLDLGKFATDLLGPVLSTINRVTKPLTPVIDLLTSEVPLLAKVGLDDNFDLDGNGTATLAEVALTLAGGLNNAETAVNFAKFVDAITGVLDLSESLVDLEASIAGGQTLTIQYGSYTLEDFKGASSTVDASTIDPATSGNSSNLSSDATSQTKSSSNNQVNNLFGKIGDLGITLEVIENPLNAIKIFLGQDSDIMMWDVPELELAFSIKESFPIFGSISGVIGGDFSISADLAFGFDTAGLREWKEKDFALEDAYLAFDGFYLSDVDPDTGEDIDELTLDATITAGLEVDAFIAKITAEGGITGTARFDLIDVGEYTGESDGRVRGSEIISRIGNPTQLFEITGKVEAFLKVIAKVGYKRFSKTVYKQELARFTLFEFSIGGGGGSSSGALAASSVDSDAAVSSGQSLASSQFEEVTTQSIVVVAQGVSPSLVLAQSISEPVQQAEAAVVTTIAPSLAPARSELVDLALAFTLQDRSDFLRPAKTRWANPILESEGDVDLLRRYAEGTRPKKMAETLDIVTRRDEGSSSDDFSDVEERQAWEDALDEVFGGELVRL